MMQRQQRADSAGNEVFGLFFIMRERGLVKPSFLRLDAAPFHAEAIDLKPQLRHQVRILPPAHIMIVCNSGAAAIVDMPLFVPVIPAVVFVPAFDLRCSRRRAEEHAFPE